MREGFQVAPIRFRRNYPRCRLFDYLARLGGIYMAPEYAGARIRRGRVSRIRGDGDQVVPGTAIMRPPPRQ